MPMEFRYDREKEALYGAWKNPLTLDDCQAAMKDITQSDQFAPAPTTAVWSYPMGSGDFWGL
jgi:hypothetical protein